MITLPVHIRACGKTFSVSIRIDDLDDLPPNIMPDGFGGVFVGIGDLELERILFSKRAGNLTDPLMYIYAGRDVYRFTMSSWRSPPG